MTGKLIAVGLVAALGVGAFLVVRGSGAVPDQPQPIRIVRNPVEGARAMSAPGRPKRELTPERVARREIQ